MCLTLLKDFVLPISSIVVAVIALFFSRRAYMASRRPHLIFSEDEIKEDGNVELGIYLRNIGMGPAFNIEIASKFVNQYSFLSKFAEIPRNLSPDGATLFERNKLGVRFIKPEVTIEVTYQNHEGKEYKTTLSQLRHYFSEL